MIDLQAAVSQRGGVPPFHAMRVFDAAAQRRARGEVVYDLTAGQPSTPAPAAVRAAAHRALDSELIGYTMAMGIPPVRAAVARHYQDHYDMDVAPADVIMTTGSSGAFLLTFLAAFSPGDLVALPRPGYPAYRNTLTALGCQVLDLPCDASTRYQPTVAMLAALDPRPVGLVLASPANPTGTMLTPADLGDIARWCEQNGVRLISDEIYHGITYSTTPTSAWQTSRRAVVINSFSKYFAMTGWRLGWILTPPELTDAIDSLATNLALCPPTLAQHAAVHAFDDYAELDAQVERYRLNRELLVRRLPEIGIDRFAPPDGAFYIYADVSRWTEDSLNWVFRLLDETGVALAPGVDFDPVDGGRYVRLSFAGPTAVIDRAVTVLGDWLSAQPESALRASGGR